MARWVVKRNPISYSRFESRLRAIRVLRTATPFLRRPLFSELERVCDVSLDLRFVLIFRHPGMVPRNFDAGPTFIPGMPALRPNQPGGQLPKLRVASSNLVARSNKIKGLAGKPLQRVPKKSSLYRHHGGKRPVFALGMSTARLSFFGDLWRGMAENRGFDGDCHSWTEFAKVCHSWTKIVRDCQSF